MSAMARDTGSSFRWSVGTLAALLILLSLFGTGSALKQPKCDNIASAASNHTELNTTLAQDHGAPINSVYTQMFLSAGACALKHAGVLSPLMFAMLMATPAKWDPMPMSAAAALVRQAGAVCMYWGPTGILATLAWWLACQMLDWLYLAVALPCITIAALMGRRARSYYHSGCCSAQQHCSLGPGVGQWITVYDEPPRQPLKQRCHEHVPSTHLTQLAKKGTDDGMYISSVASYHELWTLVMDACTSFTAQVHYSGSQNYLHTPFLPEVWIADRQEENFHITAIAGGAGGSILVVMSKGVPYTHQLYKVSASFPIKWISTMWTDGYYITSMAHIQTRWVIVMSRDAGFMDQCVELDFQPLSEGYRKWAAAGLGYQITAVAATPDGTAAVLSVARLRTTQNLQEIRNTPQFPSASINKQYIAGIAYGRTAS